MQLTLPPYVTAGVVVIGAGLIHVTPTAAPDMGQRGVELAAAWDVLDPVGPIDGAVNSFGGGAGLALPSPADGDLPEYLDPAFWESWWNLLSEGNLLNAWFGLLGGLSSIPVIGPFFAVFGDFSLLLLLAFGGPSSAVADGLGVPGDAEAFQPDPSAVMSIPEPSAIGDLGAVFDPAGVSDISALQSLIPIPEPDPGLVDVLMSLMP